MLYFQTIVSLIFAAQRMMNLSYLYELKAFHIRVYIIKIRKMSFVLSSAKNSIGLYV
uniref:Uncharacterized protein n=2 Tax=Arundo donax TaxID=35708 RepID=A0A0A9CB34_ARUDO